MNRGQWIGVVMLALTLAGVAWSGGKLAAAIASNTEAITRLENVLNDYQHANAEHQLRADRERAQIESRLSRVEARHETEDRHR